MGASKPLAYCQDLQVAAGLAKPSGGYETCASSSRNEKLNRRKDSSGGTETTVSEIF